MPGWLCYNISMSVFRKNLNKGFTPPPTFKRKLVGGFTLVELLVTITIFSILTGVVLFSQSKFNSTILLTNLAYDTALTIRQAQNYGINVKEFNSNSGGIFVPYGVHFENTTEANKRSFILFADINFAQSNVVGVYDSQADLSKCQSEYGCVNRYNIQRGNYISDICVYHTDGLCYSTNKLDIIFQRPNPDAKIYAGGSIGDDGIGYPKAEIHLSGTDGSERRVIVQSNGLIEIETAPKI